MLRKAWVVGISAALVACVRRNCRILGRRATPAGARDARSSERQYAHDQNAKRDADHGPTQRRRRGHRDSEGIDVGHPGQLVCRHYRDGATGRHDQGRELRQLSDVACDAPRLVAGQ